MSTNKEKRKVNKRSGSFRLDPSSPLYSGDKNNSSFLGGEGSGCSLSESAPEVKSEVSKWILNSSALHDAVTDLFIYNQEARLAKDEIDEIIKSAIEDGIRDYSEHSENPITITFDERMELVNELLPEVIRMFKNEYDSAITEDVKSELQKLADQLEDEEEQMSSQDKDQDDDTVVTEAKFSDDLGREYGRTKKLHQWTDPNGEVHKMFVAYEKESGEPHWFITYDVYDDVDFDTDSEKVAYEIWDGLKADYGEEVDDDLDKQYPDPDLESKSLTEDESDEDPVATPEQMAASVKYIQDNIKKLEDKNVKVYIEYDTFNDEIDIEFGFDIPYDMVEDLADDLKRCNYRFIVGKTYEDQWCYDKKRNDKDTWDTGALAFESPEDLFNLLSEEKDKIDEIFDLYENDEDYRLPPEPDYDAMYDDWRERRDFPELFDSVSYNGYYKLVKLKEGYSLKTASDRIPMIAKSVVPLTDREIIKLNESTKIIEKKVIKSDDSSYKIVDKFYTNKVGGKK